MFGAKDHEVTDMMFANYNWRPNTLSSSEQTAQRLGRSSYDYYAGFDIQGRALQNSYWRSLKNSKISVGFWGAHSQSLIHQSATGQRNKRYSYPKGILAQARIDL